MTEPSLFLCTDLDRTLLPNGNQPETAGARDRFRALVSRPFVRLAYVSGRDQALVRKAITDYALPWPDFIVGDVGTSVYSVDEAGRFSPIGAWSEEINRDWPAGGASKLVARLADIPDLRLQEDEKQSRFKLSYYAGHDLDATPVLAEINARLAEDGIKADLIWSVDETSDTGLLDIIPAGATKLHAVEFVIAEAGFDITRTVYAGDSGNDLPVLTSPIPSVLVANATDAVRREAVRLAAEAGTQSALYLARGGFLGMNGNYAAGILEGVARYHDAMRSHMTP